MQKTKTQHLIVLILCVMLTGIFGNVLQAEIEPGFGDGSDGDLTVNSEITVDDVRTAVTGSNTAGQNTIEVSDASGFSVGDEVLIISMQDPETNLDLNVAGQYETKRISVISGNTLTFDSALTYTYDIDNNRKHQIQRVPQYQNVTVESGGTITCYAWDGTTGGIVFFRSTGTVTVNSGGKVDVSGKGYRGVSHPATYRNQNGTQGESILGLGTKSSNNNASGGGGGIGTQDAGGGAGGGYGTAGNNGVSLGSHSGGSGGVTLGYPGLSRLYFGGAGGEGGADEDGNYPGAGGNGGGILLVSAQQMQIDGSILCNGQNGGNASQTMGCGMGGGGGGAGGSLYLSAITVTISGQVAAIGGSKGANGRGCGGDGGNGGYGRIRIDCDTFDNTGAIEPDPFLTLSNPTIVVTRELTYDFGQVQVFLYSKKSITFQNIGRPDLNIELAIDNPRYTIEPVVSFTLAVGETKEIFIRFAPIEEWFMENGTLTISSNDPTNSEIQVELHGIGIPYSNKAISFDGDGDFGKVAHNDSINFDINTPFTIEGWFNTAQASASVTPQAFNWDVLMAKWSGTGSYPYAIMLNPANGTLMFIVSDGFASANAISSKRDLNDGKWHHFAAINDPGAYTLKLIVDNTETTGDASLLDAISNTSDLFLSKRGGDDPAYFGGQLDEVRIWSSVRTSAELRSGQNKPVVGNETGLIAYWRFDEQSGTNTSDLSGNGNDVEMNGDTTLIFAPWPHGEELAPSITSINPSSGNVGDTVTIIGEHFGNSQGTSIVKFGEIDAGQVISWSDTSIQTKVPAVADVIVSVTVTVDGLQSKGVNFVLSGGGPGTLTVTFDKGLNMVSPPNRPATPYTAKTFAEKIGDVTLLIRRHAGNFEAYLPNYDTDDGFPIEGGQGYIVNVTASKSVDFTGTAWDNANAAPNRLLIEKKMTTWAFVVASSLPIELQDQTNFTIRVKNTNSGKYAIRNTQHATESFRIVLVDANRNAVVEAGDQLSIEVTDADGRLVAEKQVVIDPADLANAYKFVNLSYNPIPDRSALLQNYPNPFNPETWIPFHLSERADVTISIYDISGKLIRTLVLGDRHAGFYATKDRAAYWNGRNEAGEKVSSGVYFYQIDADEFYATKRMVILK